MAKKKNNLKVIKKTKGATVCETKNGKRITLLTPTGKCNRYRRELQSGKSTTTGKTLTSAQRSYRIGYRAALGEQAKIYNKKHGGAK